MEGSTGAGGSGLDLADFLAELFITNRTH